VDSSSDFVELLVVLVEAGVEFVVVGGVAAVAQGAPITTLDVDIVHRRTSENVARLIMALKQLDAHARQRPGLVPGAAALGGPGHQLLDTRLGPLDVLGEIEGGRGYDELRQMTLVTVVRGREVQLLSLEALLESKRRSSREKDRLIVPLLEAAIRERDA
jgi:hypothetical protein